ncbi:MAG: diguanylate cyclase [Pseudomonadota bacterium]
MLATFKRSLYITAVAMGLAYCIVWCVISLGLSDLPPSALPIALFAAFLIAGPTSLILETQKGDLAKTNAELLAAQQELQKMMDRLRVKAERDALTGLANREHFETLLDRYLQRDGGGTILMVDVDHFKSVNDTYGHEAGDDALCMIATALTMTVRPDDLVGRRGGEEFIVFLRNIETEGSVAVAQRLRDAVKAIDFIPEGHGRHQLAISIGGAWCSADHDIARVIDTADKALYSAKNSGRDRYHYQPTSAQLSLAA